MKIDEDFIKDPEIAIVGNAADPEIRATLSDEPRQQAVAAADVQHPGALRQQRVHVLAQDPQSAVVVVTVVEALEPVHRRPIPRIETKKLHSTVWKPRAARVTPGTTKRRVRA